MTPIALTIAGSDTSAGAGIQADLKTFAALGVYGTSVITALTAQNTKSVTAIHAVPASFVTAQLEALAADMKIAAIKIGMLADSAIIEAVAEALTRIRGLKKVPVILDPVMTATTGDPLLQDAAVETIVTRLFPRATLVTPNLAEAARFLGEPRAQDESAMIAQARKLQEMGAPAVLIKGGHSRGELAADLLLDDGSDDGVMRLESLRIYTKNTHGTGCTLSAAIAAAMAKGAPLRDAAAAAKAYVTGAIAAADRLQVGKGRGPLFHLYRQWPDRG